MYIIPIAIIILLVPVVLIIRNKKGVFTPKASDEIGKLGESTVSKKLGGTIPGVQYEIDDILIKNPDGSTTQIDHIFINENGVFVIETKNYHGMIFGSENEREWTQVLSYGKTKNKFYNPLKQNTTHIKRVKECLPKKIPVFGAVVFPSADISNVSANGVCDLYTLKKLVSFPQEKKLTVEEMEKFFGIFNSLKENCDISMEEHIQNVEKARVYSELNTCPRCGKTLVLKNGKHGQFYGCSGYPMCKYTRAK